MGIFKTENSLVGYLIIARNAEVLALWKLYVERQERVLESGEESGN